MRVKGTYTVLLYNIVAELLNVTIQIAAFQVSLEEWGLVSWRSRSSQPASPACLGLLISSIFQVHTLLVEWLADLYNIAVYKYAKCNKNIFILACYLHIG